jgi:hypothetical protein
MRHKHQADAAAQIATADLLTMRRIGDIAGLERESVLFKVKLPRQRCIGSSLGFDVVHEQDVLISVSRRPSLMTGCAQLS